MGTAIAQKRGGVLKFAVPSVKTGLDPAHTSTGDGYMLTQAIFSNLTRADENLEARPQLARSWEANADASAWTFSLVQGAKFHNGREVTADDVAFTIQRILDPKTASRGAKAIGPIKKVAAKDKYTVVFELDGPYADLPVQLSNQFTRIVARENIDKVEREPIGSGPFKLKEYIPGSKAVLVRNADYFEKGLPYLDEVHQVYLKEYAAQLSALSTGEIHIMYLTPVELIPHTTSGRPGMEEAAIAYRESAKEAGVRVKIESIEVARLYSEVLRKPADFSLVQINWFGQPTVDASITPFVFTKSFWNFTEDSNPRVDSLLTEASRTIDVEKRKRLYNEVQKILWEEGPELIPYFRNYISAIRKTVKNYKLIPLQGVELRDKWLDR